MEFLTLAKSGEACFQPLVRSQRHVNEGSPQTTATTVTSAALMLQNSQQSSPSIVHFYPQKKYLQQHGTVPVTSRQSADTIGLSTRQTRTWDSPVSGIQWVTSPCILPISSFMLENLLLQKEVWGWFVNGLKYKNVRAPYWGTIGWGPHIGEPSVGVQPWWGSHIPGWRALGWETLSKRDRGDTE